MKLLILVSLIVAVAADTLGSYSLPRPSGPGLSLNGFGSSSSGHSSGFSSGGSGFSSGGSGYSGGSCGPGQVRHVDGNCVTPQVTRNTFVYTAPPSSPILGPRPPVPPPRLEHNVIFVHTPASFQGQKPIVIPPPQQTNTVYVLNKRPEVDQELLHVPAGEQDAPEVFFVSYKEGENPKLPTGENLQDALNLASQGGGQVIGSGGGGVGGGVGVGGGIGGGFGVGIGGGIGGGGGSYGVTTPSSLYSAP